MLELLDLRDRRARLEPRRLEIDPHVSDTVRGIIQRVRAEGDDVLFELALKFDGADLRGTGLLATPEEFERAHEAMPRELQRAIDALVERITDLHRRQLPHEWLEERDGVRSGEIVRPLRRVGCYVPGGRAVYPSSVCMTVVPAVVAGVEEIVLCSPPQQNGELAPSILYAAARAGATKVVKTGGAQAIAAMTYGTASVPAVDRIVGPGNAYVTEAKRQVAGIVGIDGLAGPSELVVVADSSADLAFLATDLVAQAEHDPEASAILVTPEPALAEAALEALNRELTHAGRREIVDAAFAHARVVLVADLDHAADVVNDLAPEHLQLLLEDARGFLHGVRNAGAIFLGPWTPVPFGDYGVASNHVLPTAGTARFASGLRAADFVTVSSVVEMTQGAAAALAPEISAIGRSEGLVGHARAVEIRAERAADRAGTGERA